MNPVDFVIVKPEEHSFSTRLSPEECVRRLEQSIPHLRRSYFGVYFETGIYGILKPPKIILWYHPEVLYNTNNSIYGGKLIAEGTGTILMGYFDVSNWVKIFVTFYFGFAIFYLLVVILVISQRGFTLEIVPFILAPIIVIVVGSALIHFITNLGKQNRPYVIEFISNALEATPVQT